MLPRNLIIAFGLVVIVVSVVSVSAFEIRMSGGFTNNSTGATTTVTLSGADAERVCGALRMPCPSSPTFVATESGNSSNPTYIVRVSGVNQNYGVVLSSHTYTVELNESSYCVTPSVTWAPPCR